MNVAGSGGSRVATIARALRSRNYRLFFFGQGISLTGTWMQRVALSWLVYRLTGSEALLGIVAFAGQIPTFLLASFAGVLADRWNVHRAIVVTQVLALIQALVLAVLTLTGTITPWHIVALSVALGLINAFDIPLRQTFVVEMIEQPEDLPNAIALNSFLVNGARLVGPSVAGLLIAIVGEAVCFLINGLSYIPVILALLAMTVVPKRKPPALTHVLGGLAEGFSYAFGFPPIRAVLLLLATVSLVGMPYAVLLPVFAKDILHGTSNTFGLLMGASGLGAITGALVLAGRRSVVGLGGTMARAAIVFGAGLIAFSLSHWMWLSLTLMAVTGFGMMLQLASCNTVLQTIVDDDKRGRVMSMYTMAFMGTFPFGSLLAGFVAQSIGAPTTLMIGGGLCVAAAGVFLTELPELRKLVRPIYERKGIMPAISQAVQTASGPGNVSAASNGTPAVSPSIDQQ
jgi:MFS family permease